MTKQHFFSETKKCWGYVVFITNFQFRARLTLLGVSQMVQSPMGTRLVWERRRRVQFGIFLNQGIDFEYTQLLPGVEMIQLKLWSQGPTLLYGNLECSCICLHYSFFL